jgi:hypothetical protein
MENRTYRMYGLVPYNISPIQQGIQFGHAVVEYGLDYVITSEYQKWAKQDKTFIILNGGTTNNNPESLGSLNQHLQTLLDNNVKLATFSEPDLGDQLTAIVFLVDDRVFDKKNWPDYDGPYYADMKTPMENIYYEWKMEFSDDEKTSDRIIFLREFLKQFRFA